MQTLKKLVFAIALTIIATQALAQSQCRDSFDSTPAPIAVNLNLPPPLEFQYQGTYGQTRFYRDGAIWELINGNWIHIGYGQYDSYRNVVLENQVNGFANAQHQQQTYQTQIPDLRPLRNFQTNVTQSIGQRFYPNAGIYFESLIHTLWVGNHPIEVIIPRGTGLEHSAQGILRTIEELPLKRIESLRTLRVNSRANVNDNYWRQQYQNFTQSAATAGKGEIDIYGAAIGTMIQGGSEANRIARHEFGHLIAESVFGSTTPGASYVNRASQDRFAVSEYGKNSWAEDFAEGIEAYLRSNAGQLHPTLRSDLARRFAFFDDVFNYRTPQSVQEPKLEMSKNQVFVKMIGEREILAIAPDRGIGILLKF